jgi:hypothetical protein
MQTSHKGIQPFSTAREALTFMASADGYLTVLHGNYECTVPMSGYPQQAQEALDRINDPWPADCVQSIR